MRAAQTRSTRLDRPTIGAPRSFDVRRTPICEAVAPRDGTNTPTLDQSRHSRELHIGGEALVHRATAHNTRTTRGVLCAMESAAQRSATRATPTHATASIRGDGQTPPSGDPERLGPAPRARQICEALAPTSGCEGRNPTVTLPPWDTRKTAARQTYKMLSNSAGSTSLAITKQLLTT